MTQSSPNVRKMRKRKNKPPWQRSGGKKKRRSRRRVQRSRSQDARDHALDFQGFKSRSHTTSTKHPRKFSPWSPTRCRAVLRSL